mmetsp:Transcript_25593/g.39292  ORF Transcript_25593/g.39292 Transcript_25593/m.39292 type:complete len:81 (-) Transcript_25593:121-363(-)
MSSSDGVHNVLCRVRDEESFCFFWMNTNAILSETPVLVKLRLKLETTSVSMCGQIVDGSGLLVKVWLTLCVWHGSGFRLW